MGFGWVGVSISIGVGFGGLFKKKMVFEWVWAHVHYHIGCPGLLFNSGWVRNQAFHIAELFGRKKERANMG